MENGSSIAEQGEPGVRHSAPTRTGKVLAGIGIALLVGAVLSAGFVVHAVRERRAELANDTTPDTPGTSFHTITVDGRDRTYTVHVPTDLPAGPVPLVLGLHGGTGSGQQFEKFNHMDTVADAQGFIAVYPDGIESRIDLTGTGTRTWNAGVCCGRAAKEHVDDVAFISAVIDDVEAAHAIDTSRVVAIGHSNGGMLAYRLACELSDKVTGIAVYGSTLTIDSCKPGRPVSVFAVHGEKDVNVPYEGGQGKGLSNTDYRPVPETIDTMVDVDGCDPDPTASSGVEREIKTWTGCDDDTAVEHVVLIGATHAWPGGSGGRHLDKSVDFDASAVMAAWLIDHPRSVV